MMGEEKMLKRKRQDARTPRCNTVYRRRDRGKESLTQVEAYGGGSFTEQRWVCATLSVFSDEAKLSP